MRISINVQLFQFLGPETMFFDLIFESLGSGKDIIAYKEKVLEANKSEQKTVTKSSISELTLATDVEKQLLVPKIMPNFLSPQPDLKDLYGISDLSKPYKRFQLIGDLPGFLKMAHKVDKVKLDVKSFSLILHCIAVSLKMNLN